MSCGKKRAARPKRRPKSRKCGKSKSSHKKCARPGPTIKNPFINFLRDFRKKRCGKSMPNISKEAAKIWKCMNICKRSKYIQQACGAGGGRRGKKKSHRRRHSRSKKRSRKSGAGCGKKRRPKKKKRVC